MSETINYGPFTKTHSYAYLKNGLKESFTGPDNVTYGYVYDTANRLAGVRIPDVGFISVNDYTWNRPSGLTLPGGGTRGYSYDPLMRISRITAKDPAGNNLLNYAYTHDNMDNITAKTTEHGDYAYGYDALHRLTSADNPETTGLADEAFTYDAVGNRLTSAATVGSWTYNGNNELETIPPSSSGATGGAGLEYDANGNTVKKTVDGVVTSYVYNTEDRLAQVWNGNAGSGTLTASYYYDPFGRRLWKEVGGTKTYYHYADEGLDAEMNADGDVVKTYGWQPGGTWGTDPLFMRVAGNCYFYHNDHLGTPQKLTARSGEVVWNAKYESFGKAVVAAGATVENNLRFPGQYYDAETGLHYNFWRYYEPGTGRYLRQMLPRVSLASCFRKGIIMKQSLFLSILLVMAIAVFAVAGDDLGSDLIQAATKGDVRAVERLLAEGADINTQDDAGRTALCAASSYGRLKIVDILLRHGADVHAKDNAGWTALHFVCYTHDIAIVTMLLEKGANVNARDNSGMTPLHVASTTSVSGKYTVKSGQSDWSPTGKTSYDIVQLLLKNGADVNARDISGRTPLFLAARSPNVEIVKLLLKNGADADVRTEDGKTAKDIAIEKGYKETGNLLK